MNVIRKSADPGLLEGEDLDAWYRRPLSLIVAEREAERLRRANEFYGARPDELGSADDDLYVSDPMIGNWREARAPMGPVLRPAPVATRAGAPDRAGVPVGGSRGGFFDTHAAVPNPLSGPAYITDLPRPLNVVTPRFGGWFELGDGTLVQGADEVERINAEQQRMIRGEDEPEPAPRGNVREVDRLPSGVIPHAQQMEKRDRELDPTCHPNGGWELEPGYSRRPKRTKDYEEQIAHAPGLDYVVRNPGENAVKFDGCAVWNPRHELLEAKGPGYESIVENGRRWNFLPSIRSKTNSQASRQSRSSWGRPVHWHVAEPGALPFFRDVLDPYPIDLQHTPVN